MTIQELKSAWLRANEHERYEFESWMAAQRASAGETPRIATPETPLAVRNHLLPWVKSRIKTVMAKRDLRVGDVMVELGLNRRNSSLGNSLVNDKKLSNSVLAELEIWLKNNEMV
ncbi:hypothetical protein AWN88_06215 [Agrobacterium tumefaciens]|nr:hypothetical protein AWN88_06215 [Agrobacterium tumefaciens]KAJ36587.1 hypothetical protein BW45_20020 [Agrobacterium tumefaciens]